MVGDKNYLNFLAKFGVSSAHPGGLPLTRALFDKIPCRQNEHVLDVGCGTGETSVYLAKRFGCRVTAVDIQPLMVQHARNRARAERLSIDVYQANAEKLPFADRSFDRVVAESVTVFTNAGLSLPEYRRVLKPNGVLIDLEMTAARRLTDSEAADVKKVYDIDRVLTEADWLEALKGAGFQDITVYTGEDLLDAEVDLPDASGFEFTRDIDLDAFNAWFGHIQIMEKYSRILNYRVYVAKAPIDRRADEAK